MLYSTIQELVNTYFRKAITADQCIVVCRACVQACQQCITQCSVCPNQDAMHAACIKSCQVCIAACEACSAACQQYGLSDPRCVEKCKACVESCQTCAGACRAMNCQMCAAACTACVESCATCAQVCAGNVSGLGKATDPNVGGGVNRDKLPDSKFVFPDERAFPIVKPGDVSDAVSSWGRYKGPHSFEDFKAKLKTKAQHMGAAFARELPQAWKEEDSKKLTHVADLIKRRAAYRQVLALPVFAKYSTRSGAGASISTEIPSTDSFHRFLKLNSVTEDADRNLIVEGYATCENPDDQPGVWKGVPYAGDIIDAEGVRRALPDYMEFANVREMHQDSAAGVVLKAELVPGEVTLPNGEKILNPLWIVAKIVDEEAKTKIREGVYKGFSIAGHVVEAILTKIGNDIFRRITDLVMAEISLVDRPANRGARILLWKGH